MNAELTAGFDEDLILGCRPLQACEIRAADYPEVTKLVADMCHRGANEQPFKIPLGERLFIMLERADKNEDRETVFTFLLNYPRFTGWWVLNTSMVYEWKTVREAMEVLSLRAPPCNYHDEDKHVHPMYEVQLWIVELTRLQNPNKATPVAIEDFGYKEVPTGGTILDVRYVSNNVCGPVARELRDVFSPLSCYEDEARAAHHFACGEYDEVIALLRSDATRHGNNENEPPRENIDMSDEDAYISTLEERFTRDDGTIDADEVFRQVYDDIRIHARQSTIPSDVGQQE